MLSYLSLCAREKIEVTGYHDNAWGKMEKMDGSMRFTEVILKPAVTVAAGGDLEKARQLHNEAHSICFIANSVNFPVRHEATVEIIQ